MASCKSVSECAAAAAAIAAARRWRVVVLYMRSHKNWNLCQRKLLTSASLIRMAPGARHLNRRHIDDGAPKKKKQRRQSSNYYYLRAGKLFLIHHTHTVAV